MNKLTAANSIYLGDIDPNNEKILDPAAIRRRIMCDLLIWDSIVLSDSQYLTDPRIPRLMQDYDGPESKVPDGYIMRGVEKHQKGFERFLQSGLVEVSHRQKGDEVYTLQKVWQGMAASGNVPFLPDTVHYASYLDSLAVSHRDYKLSSIADRFRNHLLAGVASGDFVLSATDETDQHLLQMFHQNPVYFRDIYEFIGKQRDADAITQERYEDIYDYVFSCYSVNISEEIGCYVSSKLESVPLHLDSSAGNFNEALAGANQGGVCPTWRLNPNALDMIPIDEFIDVRNEARKVMPNSELVNYYTGATRPKDWKDFCGR